MEKLIKSRQRVKEHAEVFTPSHVVKQMVDMVEKELGEEDYAFKTWFDPAVGTGNFPADILERKLKWCKEHDIDNMGMLRALSSIYAVDIQEDNVNETRERLLKIFYKYKISQSTDPVQDAIINAAAPLIVKNNIVLGDTINEPEKIVFLKYEEEGFPLRVSEHKLSNMLGEDYMKDLEKRRKKAKQNSPKNRN